LSISELGSFHHVMSVLVLLKIGQTFNHEVAQEFRAHVHGNIENE